MKLTYYRNGDYLLPDLAVNETDQQPLGKYGMLRLHFLQAHRPVLYNELLLSGKLVPHLHEIDMTCIQSLELLMPQMMALEGVDEELKARNQMEWVARMNSIKARMEERLFAELICNRCGTNTAEESIMLLTILKAPLKIAALLLAFLLLLVQLACTLLLGISAFLMNLLASLFLAGAVAGWIVHAEAMLVWRTAGAGIFSALLPSLAEWLLDGVAWLTERLWDFAMG